MGQPAERAERARAPGTKEVLGFMDFDKAFLGFSHLIRISRISYDFYQDSIRILIRFGFDLGFGLVSDWILIRFGKVTKVTKATRVIKCIIEYRIDHLAP